MCLRIERSMANILKIIAALYLVVGVSSHAVAVDWCEFARAAQSVHRNFDLLRSELGTRMGCVSIDSDSAHFASWDCGGEIEDGGAKILLSRVPGEYSMLMLMSKNINSLDGLYACEIHSSDVRVKFFPETLVRVERLKSLVGRREVTLVRKFDNYMVYTIDGLEEEDRISISNEMEDAFTGVSPDVDAETEVELAGLDPVRTAAVDIVEAFLARGASIRQAEQGDLGQTWELSAPRGLAGVSTVKIISFYGHLLKAIYEIDGEEEYKRYIELLDGQYGASQRSPEGECTSRKWISGTAMVKGMFCKNAKPSVAFYNMTSAKQLNKISERLEESSRPEPVTQPSIDADMF